MSWRKGYSSEYFSKKLLIKQFGKNNVFKIAIGGLFDYLVINKGKIIKLVEIKETNKKHYYPNPREKIQFNKIINLAKEVNAPAELWIYFRKGRGKSSIKHVQFLFEPSC